MHALSNYFNGPNQCIAFVRSTYAMASECCSDFPKILQRPDSNNCINDYRQTFNFVQGLSNECIEIVTNCVYATSVRGYQFNMCVFHKCGTMMNNTFKALMDYSCFTVDYVYNTVSYCHEECCNNNNDITHNVRPPAGTAPALTLLQ